MGEVKLPDTFDVGGLEIPDTAGLHGEYVTRTLLEDAGEGNVRVIKCVILGGVLTPRITYVTPAAYILRDAIAAIEFVKRIMCGRHDH